MKTGKKTKRSKLLGEDGVTLVLIAIMMIMLIAFAALALDVAHLYVVRNELQNAADAGALAGARCLYGCTGSGSTMGSIVNTDANNIANAAAIANKSEKVDVEVNAPDSNVNDVQRGHWSFATRTFTQSNWTTPPVLWDYTTQELDAADCTGSNLCFINAVKVTTRRENTQAASFFAKILGFMGFTVKAEAVAYIGFTGSLNPEEVDQPIAICRQSLLNADGEYTCNTGRMLNSGSNNATHNTAGWTNFSQPCSTSNASDMKKLICSSGNPVGITFGLGIGATGGVQDTTLSDLRDCFGPTTRTEPWDMTLPVIDCPGNNVSNCATVMGAVHLSIVWISDKDNFAQDDFPPARMGTWTPPSGCGTDRQCAWDDFVEHFKLKNVDDLTATYAKKSIYFLPDCTVHEPKGVTGGANYGILAKIPVLVN
jgi:Flp pilus assembly protein TadG